MENEVIDDWTPRKKEVTAALKPYGFRRIMKLGRLYEKGEYGIFFSIVGTLYLYYKQDINCVPKDSIIYKTNDLNSMLTYLKTNNI
ncbi:MAG: hypothetical protein FWG20_05730 [Candidatus Cloacimonetes bacterium]|nr:hypothetical protein [Candidatus Cloacimonadota bacterium]